MVNILLFSLNKVFCDDLQEQILRYTQNYVFMSEMPDLVIIDEDTAEYLRLRKTYPAAPFIFLAENCGFTEDSLNIFVKKPFRLATFLDILRAANNKLDNSADGYLYFNHFELRPSLREIEDLLSGEIFRLTEKEVGILKYLYKMSGSYVSKSDLQKNVWGYNEDAATHTIETHIYRLRQKVEKNESRRLINTDNGGYTLIKEEECRN